MKKYFLIAMGLVTVLAVSLIGYGVFVNYEGESIIQERMNNRAVVVSAAKAQYRNIYPQYEVGDAFMDAKTVGDIVAKVEGIISTTTLHKNLQVHEGDTIMTLTNRELPLKINQAESALKKAQAVEVQARNSYNRYSRLMEQDATSMEKLDEAKANYEAAKAAVVDAQAQYDQAVLTMSRLNVVSDLNGTVLLTYKDPGEYVSAGTPVCMVGDFSVMWFGMDIEDHALKALLGEQGQEATFNLTLTRPDMIKPYSTEYYAGNDGANTTFKVVIYGIYPALNEPAAMRRIVFDVFNPTGVLEARSYEHLMLTSTFSRNALTVPVRALTNNNDKTTIMVVDENNQLIKKNVKVGAISGNYVEILSGVSTEDTVVISGVDDLREGQKVTVNMEDI